MIRCSLCDKHITDGRWFQRVVGWDRPRHGGGSNQIHLKEHTHVYACVDCIERLKRNVIPGQRSLL